MAKSALSRNERGTRVLTIASSRVIRHIDIPVTWTEQPLPVPEEIRFYFLEHALDRLTAKIRARRVGACFHIGVFESLHEKWGKKSRLLFGFRLDARAGGDVKPKKFE